MHLNNKNVAAAVALLENVESLKSSPGYVATVVSLYQQLNDTDGAIRVLDRALNAMVCRSFADNVLSFLSPFSQDKKDPNFVTLLRKSAELKMAAGRHKDSSIAFKALYDLNNTDMDALCSLIMETSYYDAVCHLSFELF